MFMGSYDCLRLIIYEGKRTTVKLFVFTCTLLETTRFPKMIVNVRFALVSRPGCVRSTLSRGAEMRRNLNLNLRLPAHHTVEIISL